MKKRSKLIALALMVATSLLLLWAVMLQPGAIAPVGGLLKRQTADKETLSAAPLHFISGTEGLPRSLQGTEVPNGLQVDASGHLLITHALRDLFDYFLSAMGEEPLPVLLARIKAFIHHARLPAVAEAEALHVLDEYVAYKKALSTLPDTAAGPHPDHAALQAKLSVLNQVRRQYLDPEVVDAFFGSEEAYDQYTLNRMAIMQDKTLTASAKAAALANALNALPEALRQSMQSQIQYESLQALTSDWKSRGGNPQELRQIRENLVGPEAADRLEALDQEQTAFQAKLNQFMQQKQQITNNTSLSGDDQQNAIDQLRSATFSPQELIRVRSLEQDKPVVSH